jgi:hypothetical protein
MLVTEIEKGDRFQCVRLACPDPRGIFVKEKYMAIELPRAATRAAVTVESDIGYNRRKISGRICTQCRELPIP